MPKNKPTRIVIDTNIWISFLISNKVVKLDSLFLEKKIIAIFSQQLLDEITKVSKYPKLKKYLSTNAVDEMIVNFTEYIDFVEVVSKVTICRDPNDNFLLSLSKDGKASFLITGDKDLLDLKVFEKTKVITLTDFIAIHKTIR